MQLVSKTINLVYLNTSKVRSGLVHEISQDAIINRTYKRMFTELVILNTGKHDMLNILPEEIL